MNTLALFRALVVLVLATVTQPMLATTLPPIVSMDLGDQRVPYPGSIPLDLDGDGVAECRIRTAPACGCDPGDGVVFECDLGSVEFLAGYGFGADAPVIPCGTPIQDTGQRWNTYAWLAYHCCANELSGQWTQPATGYVGYRLVGSPNRYGWISISNTDGTLSGFVLHEAAFNSVAGPILAGDGATVALPPSMSVPSGTYNDYLAVVLSSPTPGAVIHYTTDGSEPGRNSPSVASDGVVNIDQTGTVLRAYTAALGMRDSSVMSERYDLVADRPTLSRRGGEIPQDISIFTQTPGTQVYFTVDGSDPSSNGILYTAPIHVSTPTRLLCVAVKPGLVHSALIQGLYRYRSDLPDFHVFDGSPSPFLTFSRATCISADGSRIGGWTRDPSLPSFASYWDTSDLSLHTTGYYGDRWEGASVLAFSADGSVAVGFRGYDPVLQTLGAFHWTIGEPFAAPLPPSGNNVVAHAVSADGQVTVGHVNNQAVIWNGLAEAIYFLPEITSEARAITPDGRVIAGLVYEPDYQTKAFVWSVENGLHLLPSISTIEAGDTALAISADGLTVVGYSGHWSARWLTRWTIDPSTGDATVHPIAPTMRDEDLDLAAVSPDGLLVGGTAYGEAVLWSEDAGLVRLSDIVAEGGFELEYSPLEVAGISADKRSITGNSGCFWENCSYAWLLTFPSPCRADWDHDGVLNSADLFAFLAALFGDNADFNTDGRTTSQDFFDFLGAFFNGCL